MMKNYYNNINLRQLKFVRNNAKLTIIKMNYKNKI